jgi:hypothetical protein
VPVVAWASSHGSQQDQTPKPAFSTSPSRQARVPIGKALLCFSGRESRHTCGPIRIAELPIKSRLPPIFWQSAFAEAGSLLAYGPSLPDQLRRIGVLGGEILKGTKPAELPVEQPTKFELVFNLITAKQIGVTIPQSVLYRVDRVIK